MCNSRVYDVNKIKFQLKMLSRTENDGAGNRERKN